MEFVSSHPVGESPFHIKGVAYRGQFAFYDAKVPGGSKALVAAIEKPALKKYFEQPFIASNFYDIFPLAQVNTTAAKLLGMESKELIIYASKYQAEYDLRGIYKVLLRAFSPASVMEKIARVSAQYFDFATQMTVKSTGPKSAIIERPNHPESLAEWYLLVLNGYLPVAVTRTGATDVKLEMGTEKRGETAFGQPLVDLFVRVSWS